MKKLLVLSALTALFFNAATAQTTPTRPSPAATTTETIASGATITIDYSQPALKGRTMGKDVEPMEGKMWRAGANAATAFTISKNVTVEGKALSAGKYAFFTIKNGNDWTLIFNKTWDKNGTDDYKETDDVLRVNVKGGQTTAPVERLTYTIEKSGLVSLSWGNTKVSFRIK